MVVDVLPPRQDIRNRQTLEIGVLSPFIGFPLCVFFVCIMYYLHFQFQLQERKKLHEFEENRYFTFLCARREACLCTLPFLHRPPCKKLGSPGLGPT